MIIFNKDMLDQYLENDVMQEMLNREETLDDHYFRTHEWMKEIPAKRMIFQHMYGDLLEKQSDLKVLDVGGGYTSLTRRLVKNQDYTLLDYMAHGEHPRLRGIEDGLGKKFWISEDWYEMKVEEPYDIVIANDLFPDVDMRLQLFIEKFLPHCKEIRLLLTYYNYPKFYLTKRVDDTEILTFLSWDGEITGLKLARYVDRMDAGAADLDLMKIDQNSLYKNGRQVSYVTIKGDL